MATATPKKKPKPPPKPLGLSSKPNNPAHSSPSASRLRSRLARVFSLGSSSSSSSSQPPSPTVTPHNNLVVQQSSSYESLLPTKSPIVRRSLGSVSSTESGQEVIVAPKSTLSPFAIRRQHWRTKSDTAKVLNLLRNKHHNTGQNQHQQGSKVWHFSALNTSSTSTGSMMVSKKTPQHQLPITAARPDTPSKQPYVTSMTLPLRGAGSWHRIFRLPRLLLNTVC